MSFVSAILIAGFVVLADCGSKLKLKRSIQVRDAEALQCEQPPNGPCSLPMDLNLSGTVNVTKDLGPDFTRFSDLFDLVGNGTITIVEELNGSLSDALVLYRDSLILFFDKLISAVENYVTCPALKLLFENLKANSLALLDDLRKSWPNALVSLDFKDFLSALSQSLVNATPIVIQLLRQYIYDLFMVIPLPMLCPYTCKNVFPYLWGLLDPGTSGPLSEAFITIFKSMSLDTKPDVTDFINKLLSIDIPVIPGYNIVQITVSLNCMILQVLRIDDFLGLCKGTE